MAELGQSRSWRVRQAPADSCSLPAPEARSTCWQPGSADGAIDFRPHGSRAALTPRLPASRRAGQRGADDSRVVLPGALGSASRLDRRGAIGVGCRHRAVASFPP